MALNIMSMIEEEPYKEYYDTLNTLYKKTLEHLDYDRLDMYHVNVVFMDAEMIHDYNKKFRQVDRPTDVLSFVDGLEEDGIVQLGDLMISIDHVKNQAKEYGHSEKRELCFLFVHGMLHLCGFDHQSKEEEKEMFSLQDEILEGVAPKNEAA